MKTRAFTCLLLAALLGGCGVAEQPAATGSQAEAAAPAPQLTPTALLTASQTRVTFEATIAARQLQIEQTARALGPAPTQVIGTPDWSPTAVSSHLQHLPGGGYLNPYANNPMKHPRFANGWILDLPDKRQLRVYAGGYLFPPDKPAGPEVLKPEQGALQVVVYLFKPPTVMNPKVDTNDPRNGTVTLPVRDGMARVVDALVADGRITVMLRTDGGSAYSYEVNSGTLAPAQPPTVELGGPYRLRAGDRLDLSAQGRDTAGMQFDYAWDLDGDGSFETSGQRVTFSAPRAGAQQHTVRVRATAKSGLSATAATTVTIGD